MKCSVKGCNKIGDENKMCMRHYTQIRRKGKITRTPFDRDYEVDGTVARIKLWNKYGDLAATTVIDAEDLESVLKHNWFVNLQGYVRNNAIGTLHRYILKLPKHQGEYTVVDHINHDRLDNRKANLRLVHILDNMFNRKDGAGIIFDKKKQLWRARISMHGPFRQTREGAVADQHLFIEWRKTNWNGLGYPKTSLTKTKE